MPTLQIEGRRVKVDDSFLKLSPEEQNATVDEIARSLRITPSEAPKAEAAPAPQPTPSAGPKGNADGWSLSEEMASGMTLGAAIPITSAASVPFEMIKQGTLNPVEAYASVRDRKDRDRAAWNEENRVKGVVGNVVGGLASPVGAIKGLTGAATMGGRAAQAAATGAIYGGITSGMEARGSVADQVGQAGAGAIIGGVAGGVLSPVLEKAAAKAVSLFPKISEAKVSPLTPTGDLTPDALIAAKAAGMTDDDLANPQVLDRLKQSFTELGVAPSAARQAAADEFGIKLTPGQATADYQTIKAEQGMLRGLAGDEPQKIVGTKLDPATGAQTDEILAGAESLAQRLGGKPAATAADIQSGLQSEAAKSKGKAQASYRDAFSRKGQFERDAIAPLGEKVRTRLSSGDQPTIIDDTLTPAASKALKVLDDLSAGKLVNEALPLGAAKPAAPAAAAGPAKPNPFTTPKPDSGLKPKSLIRFLAENGGIPNNPEARARDLHKLYVPGAGPLARKTGKDIDGHWREALVEAGYLPRDLDGYTTTDIQDKLFDAIERELRGGTPKTSALDATMGGKLDDTADATLHAATQDVIRAHESVGMKPAELHTGAVEDAARMLASGKETDALTAYERAVMRLPEQDAVRMPAGKLEADLGIGRVDMRAIDQARKQLLTYGRMAAPGSEDGRAVGNLIKAFDEQVQQAMENGLFRGDKKAVEVLKQARSQWAEYKGLFSKNGAGDDAGGMVEKIVKGDRSANEIANAVMGASQVGASGVNVRLATKLKKIFGEDSDMMQGIKQSMWTKLTEKPEGMTPYGPQALAQRIDDFVSGKGAEVSKHYFKPDELAAMKRYAAVLRMTVPPQGTYSTSGTPGGMSILMKGIGKAALKSLAPFVGYAVGNLPGALAMAVAQASAQAGIKMRKDGRAIRAAEAVLRGAPVTKQLSLTARQAPANVSGRIGKPVGLLAPMALPNNRERR